MNTPNNGTQSTPLTPWWPEREHIQRTRLCEHTQQWYSDYASNPMVASTGTYTADRPGGVNTPSNGTQSTPLTPWWPEREHIQRTRRCEHTQQWYSEYASNPMVARAGTYTADRPDCVNTPSDGTQSTPLTPWWPEREHR